MPETLTDEKVSHALSAIQDMRRDGFHALADAAEACLLDMMVMSRMAEELRKSEEGNVNAKV